MQWAWDNRELVTELTIEHLQLVIIPIIVAFLLSLPIGWLATQSGRGRGVIIGAISVLYAVPSLALFVMLPAIMGTSVLSPLNVMVALALYGIAIQVRITADAFSSVPQSVTGAATAVGYGHWRRIFTVDLPLAGPVILAGMRVVSASTVSLASVGALIGVPGLGYFFTDGFNRSFPTEIMVGIVMTIIVAVALDGLLVLIGRLSMPWQSQTKTKSMSSSKAKV